MADLGQSSFAATFSLQRASTAPVRNAAGAVVEAAANQPRFDHDASGAPRGLLIEAAQGEQAADILAMLPDRLPGLPDGEAATVLHAVGHETATGWKVERRCWYSRNALATVQALLRMAGHHVSIAIFPGFLPPVAGQGGPIVRYRGREWQTPARILADRNHYLEAARGLVLVESGPAPAS